jgi:hypothetical protein
MECRLQRVEMRCVSESLEGCDSGAVSEHGRCQARSARLAVNENGAGSTAPLLAASLGPGDVELVAQYVQQWT